VRYAEKRVEVEEGGGLAEAVDNQTRMTQLELDDE
jgi:hypothetical protein